MVLVKVLDTQGLSQNLGTLDLAITAMTFQHGPKTKSTILADSLKLKWRLMTKAPAGFSGATKLKLLSNGTSVVLLMLALFLIHTKTESIPTRVDLIKNKSRAIGYRRKNIRKLQLLIDFFYFIFFFCVLELLIKQKTQNKLILNKQIIQTVYN